MVVEPTNEFKEPAVRAGPRTWGSEGPGAARDRPHLHPDCIKLQSSQGMSIGYYLHKGPCRGAVGFDSLSGKRHAQMGCSRTKCCPLRKRVLRQREPREEDAARHVHFPASLRRVLPSAHKAAVSLRTSSVRSVRVTTAKKQ